MATPSFHSFDENNILQDGDKIRQFLKTLRVVAPKATIYYLDELNGPEKGDKYDEADGLHTAKGYIYKETETLGISIRSPAEPKNLGTVNSTNNMHSQEGRVCKSEDPEGAVPNERQPDIQNLQPNNVQRHNSETCPVRVLIRTKRTGQNSLPYQDTYSVFSKADDTHAHDHSSTIDCSRGRYAQATTTYKIFETPMNNSVLTGTYGKTQLNIPECAAEHDKLSEFPMSSTPGRPTASKALWREASLPHCPKLSTTTGQMYTDGKQCLSEVTDVGKQTDNTHVRLMCHKLIHDDHTSTDVQHIEDSLADSDLLSSVDRKNCLEKYLRVNCDQRYLADCDYKYPVGGHPRNVIDSSGLAVMRFESWRLSTFSHVQNWLAVSTLRLANSGFYYDEERDDIVCFSCNLRKRDWDKSDVVAVVHLELSPDCDQANFRDDRNVPVSKYPHVGPTDESPVLPGLSQQTHHGSRDDSGGFDTDGESTDASGATGTGFSAISTSQTFHTDPQSAAENNRNASRDNIPQRDPESSTKYPSSGTPFSGKTHTNSSLAAQSAETVVQHVSRSPLDNLAGFTPPVGNDKTGQLYPTTTTTQAPSACSTPPTAQHHRYPVQPEQDRNAVPIQSGSSVPRRRDDEPVEVYNSFDVRRAVSPGNASVSARLASFVDWPARGLPSPRLLVIAGFYYLGT